MSDKRDKQDKQSGETFVDALAAMTKIHGSPSLDEQFGNGRNPFNKSASEVQQETVRNMRNGGSK
jgi:hypothetical protein